MSGRFVAISLALLVVVAALTAVSRSQPPTPGGLQTGRGPQAQRPYQTGVPDPSKRLSQPSPPPAVSAQPNADTSQDQPPATTGNDNQVTPGQNTTLDTVNTVLMLVFTGVLAVYTVRLFSVGRSQATAVADTLRANRIIERAWLHVHPANFTISPIVVGDDYRITFQIRNSGRTAAILKRVQSRANIRPMTTEPLIPESPDTYFALVDNDIGLPAIEADSYEERYLISAGPMTKRTRHDLLTSEKFICVAVRISYDDVFDCPHELGFAAGYYVADKRFAVIPDQRYNYSY